MVLFGVADVPNIASCLRQKYDAAIAKCIHFASFGSNVRFDSSLTFSNLLDERIRLGLGPITAPAAEALNSMMYLEKYVCMYKDVSPHYQCPTLLTKDLYLGNA